MTLKQKLQAAPNFKEVASLLNSPLFEHCCDVALLTLVENFNTSMSGEEAAKLHFQLEGAKRLIATLKGLATLPSEAKPNTIGQLKQI